MKIKGHREIEEIKYRPNRPPRDDAIIAQLQAGVTRRLKYLAMGELDLPCA
jgi:hypothetical protein